MENPFEIIFDKLEKIESLLVGIYKRNSINNKMHAKDNFDEILNMDQLSELLGLAKPTLYKYTSGRIIPCYKKGKKLYFKKSEIIEWIAESKVKTIKEIEDEAINSLIRRKK